MNDDINTLKRTRDFYRKQCYYQGILHPQSSNNPEKQSQINTEIVMLPYPNEIRSRTAEGARLLAYKTIGEELQSKGNLGQRNTYSRQNIQHMNKKLKQIRSSRYHESKDEKEFESFHNNNFRLTGKTKIFTMLKEENKNPIVYKSKSAHFKSRKKFKGFQSNSKEKIKPSTSFHKQKNSFKDKNGLIAPAHLDKIMPNQFKTKIKVKCVEDNPKYLATLIRKKVEFMSRQEVYDYIQKLVGKANKSH